MPIHDWTRVDAGIFHDFHLAWIFEIKPGVMLADAPPQVAFHVVDESNWYARKANAIVIHHVNDHRGVTSHLWGWQNDETRIANETRMTKSPA